MPGSVATRPIASRRALRRRRLRVFAGRQRTGQRGDDVAGERGAVRRKQSVVLVGLEVVVDDKRLAVLADDLQVVAGAFVVAVKQKFGGDREPTGGIKAS